MCTDAILDTICACYKVYKCNGLDFISSGLSDKDHTLRKVRTDRSHSRDRDKLHGVKSPAGSEPGKGKGKGPGVKKVPNKSSSASSSAATGKVTQTKTKGMSDHKNRAQTMKNVLYTLLHQIATHQIFVNTFLLRQFLFCYSHKIILASLFELLCIFIANVINIW